MVEKAYITPQFGIELQNLVRHHRGTGRLPRARPEQTGRDPVHNFAMLLEDLESGQSARCALLVCNSNIPKQMLTAYGDLDDDEEFEIEWNEETVSGISVHATARELKEKLEEFSFINPGDVGVFFGNHVRTIHEVVHEFDVFRWIVQLHNGADQFGLMIPNMSSNARQTWMGCERTHLEDTDETLDAHSVLPVGVDINNKTPMQRGAIGICLAADDPGWVFHALEARSVTTDFIEVPIDPYEPDY